MNDESILERERYRIEQIRELESEELQIEEVDGHGVASDGDDTNHRLHGGASVSAEFTFDPCLASLHTYLGDVDDTHRRMAFLEGGAIISLPLFYLEGVVLFPEATLPLRVIQPNLVAAIERALNQVDAPYTIGVVRIYRDFDNGRIELAVVGTTAEIRQYRRLEDGSLNVVTRGQQRFRLRRRWIDVGAPCGEVQIIQEDFPLRTPRDAVGKLEPLKNFCAPPLNSSLTKQFQYVAENDDSDAISEESFESELLLPERRLHQSAIVSCYDTFDASGSNDEGLECGSELHSEKSPLGRSICALRGVDATKKGKDDLGIDGKLISQRRLLKGVAWRKDSIRRFREVPRAFWPYWAYRMHDSYCLAQKAADKWKQIVGSPSMDGLVKKPDLLSFHIASKIPVSEATRQELLEIDGISYRLRREIELLENFNLVHCKTCQSVIGKRSDMVVMSSEGPLGAFVNPHGWVHEVMTLYRASGLAIIGHPVKDYSWFPGYAWTMAECASCESSMGWRFTATNKKLKPRSFWGIRSSKVADDMH